jgi:uncharacterized protein YchJ
MDTRTGEVMPAEEAKRRMEENLKIREFIQYVPDQPTREKTGKHEPCPCGSNKKFMKCCMRRQE